MRLPPLLAVVACLCAALGGGALWLLCADASGPSGGGDGAGVEGEAEGDVAAAAGEHLRDAAGRALRDASGALLPAGARRRGNVVTAPDGRTWRLQGGVWVAVAEDPANGRRHARPERDAGPQTDQEPQQGSAPAAPPETRHAVLDAAQIRPPDGVATPVDPAAWATGDGVFEPAEGSAPRLDVVSEPEHAAGRPRNAAADARARAETAEVVAQHGLRGDYFDLVGGELTEVPDVTGLVPSFSRIDLGIDFATDEAFQVPFEPETFAVRWTGFVTVTQAGQYTFTCGSDDGVRLLVDGAPVLDFTWLRPYAETTGTLALEAGRHAFELTFYENRVFASCRLFWAGPGFGKRIVPASAFTPPDALAGLTQPHVARIDPPGGRLGDVVRLRGIGFAPEATANTVTFAGVRAEVLGGGAGELVVRVPVGAETGAVTVRVGELTSLPREFSVDSVMGLFGEYHLIGHELHAMPDFDAAAPYFVRLDGPLDFHEDLLWRLPYAPDVFAARFRGFLHVPEEDDYRITLGSDDGAALDVDGKPFLEAPGLHPYREVERVVHFAPGFHPVELRFFENYGVARLRLFWQRPGDVERRPIPRGALFPPEALASLTPPTLTTVPPAAIGAPLELHGRGFGTDASLVRVRFAGDAWARPTELSDERVVVTVPRTAASGPLRVEVGVLASNAVHFERTTPAGLTADVYVFSSEEDLLATRTPEQFAARSPNLTRVETSWDRVADADWALPFPVRNVAVHWHGTLGVDADVDVNWSLQADDGALLYVDGVRVVDNAPFHGLQERYGRSVLTTGDHTFDLWWFQSDDEAKLRLYWNPWGVVDHRLVPANWFRPARAEAGGD